MLFSSPQEDELEKKIKVLKPNISEKTLRLTVDVIVNKAVKYGWLDKDHNLILAMIKKESNFAQAFGSCGEIGPLQVIPEDPHIMKIVSELSCSNEDKYCLNGRPDVNTNGKLNSFKVRRFLSVHQGYSIEAGMAEMRYWKDQYDTMLKNRFWTKYPKWYMKNNINDYIIRESSLVWWWNNLVKQAGELVWISHYNWGSKLSTSPQSRNYALFVIKIIKELEEKIE